MEAPIALSSSTDPVDEPKLSSISKEAVPEQTETTTKQSFHPLIGGYIWYPDPVDVWKRGCIVSTTDDHVYVRPEHDRTSTPIEFTYKETLPYSESHGHDTNDIALIDNMHEAPLLNLLRSRYLQDRIYTYTGEILMSINPYFDIPNLYTIPTPENQQDNNQDGEVIDHVAKEEPHIFQIAHRAYTNICQETSVQDQSIIINGESGAGKTEAAKLIVKYLVTQSKLIDTPKADNKAVELHIEQSILDSNIVLEAFGNAGTIRNDNSSRFGKFVKLLYDNANNKIVGATTMHYLLEKSRVVHHEQNERSYHVFYQLCKGMLPPDQRAFLQLGSASDYKILNQGNQLDLEEIDDAAYFQQLQQAMLSLNLTSHFQGHIFQLLAAILHLGNLEFESSEKEDEVSINESKASLSHICNLLGCNNENLTSAFTTKTTMSGRGSVFRIPLSAEQAQDTRDALCKSIYAQLFSWIIERMNHCLRGDIDEVTRSKSIGILDIFGFEILQSNSLEQFCINYANESLQQQFNQHVFLYEQENYMAEGIDWKMLEFMDNQPILDLIDKKHTGLFSILEEQALLHSTAKQKPTSHSTTSTLIQHFHRQHGSNQYYSHPKIVSSTFSIHHFAGVVEYDAANFIEKNLDNLHSDLLSLMQFNTSNAFLKDLFRQPHEHSDEPNQVHGALVGSLSISLRFRQQLSNLMKVLWSTKPHYIRCYKPNDDKIDHVMNSKLLLNQLRYSGVLEVVRIRRQGFPVRKNFDTFAAKYEILLHYDQAFREMRSKLDEASTMEICKLICKHILQSERHQLGKTQVYLQTEQMERLDRCVRRLYHDAVVRIQIAWNRFRIQRAVAYRKHMAELRRQEAAVTLQSHIKRHWAEAQFNAQRQAAIKIQALMRKCILIAKYKDQMHAIFLVQKSIRRFLAQNTLKRELQELRTSVLEGDIQSLRGNLSINPSLALVRYRDDKFKALVHYAAQSRASSSVLRVLLHHGYQDLETMLQLQDKDGNVALHHAAQCHNVEMMRALCLLANTPDDRRKSNLFGLFSSSSSKSKSFKPKSNWKSFLDTKFKSVKPPPAPTSKTLHSAKNKSLEGLLLKKRATTTRWRKRYVIVNEDEIMYAKTKKQALSKGFSKKLKVSQLTVKKSTKYKCCLEIHSPELLDAKNKHGRLYFSATNEIELQTWLSHLRNVINTTLDHSLRQCPIKCLADKTQQAILQAVNKDKYNALHHVCASTTTTPQALHAATWLLAYGCSGTARTVTNMTPLMIAIQEGKAELASLLLARGSDTEITDATATTSTSSLDQASQEVLRHLVKLHASLPKSIDGNDHRTLIPGNFYLSMYLEKLAEATSWNLNEIAAVDISIIDSKGNNEEPVQTIGLTSAKSGAPDLPILCGWHMQTPLENLASGAKVIMEFKSSKDTVIAWSCMVIDERDIDSSVVELPVYPPSVSTATVNKQKAEKGALSKAVVRAERYLLRQHK